MRVLYSGIITAFQADDLSSILSIRSKLRGFSLDGKTSALQADVPGSKPGFSTKFRS